VEILQPLRFGERARVKWNRSEGETQKLSAHSARRWMLRVRVREGEAANVCAMVRGNGDGLPASIAFQGDLYLLFKRGDIVRCHR